MPAAEIFSSFFDYHPLKSLAHMIINVIKKAVTTFLSSPLLN
jgi:hypothetical protein